MGEEREQRAPEAADIGDENRLRVPIELGPGELLDQLLHRADPARQGDKGVGALEHRLLAFVHVLDDQHLLDIGQRMFLADEEARNDPGDIAAGGKRRPGEASHQPLAAAAIDEADPFGRERAPELLSRVAKPRIGAVARPAIDANVPNRTHAPICRPWPSGVKPRAQSASSPISRRISL